MENNYKKLIGEIVAGAILLKVTQECVKHFQLQDATGLNNENFNYFLEQRQMDHKGIGINE